MQGCRPGTAPGAIRLPGGRVPLGRRAGGHGRPNHRHRRRRFVASKKLTPDSIVSRLRGTLGRVESKGDWLAAAADMTTNYYEHTGIQSTARSLISRAAAEV
jgi:hypothetical protein